MLRLLHPGEMKITILFTKSETVVFTLLAKRDVYKEFNIKRHYQTKHANAYDKLLC